MIWTRRNGMACALTMGLLFSSSLMAEAGGKKLAPTPTGKKTGLIPREILFGNPEKAGAKISPNGKYLSFLAPVKGVMNVWVAPVEDIKVAEPVTKDTVRGIRSYFWGYTSNHILYTQDTGGDEDYHLYAVDLKTRKTRDLTPMKKIRAEIDSVSHRFPEEILVGINDRVPQFHDLYRINILTGDRKLVQKNDGFAGFITDEDYKVRFASKFASDGGNAIYKKSGDGKFEEFTKIPMEDSLTTNFVGFDKSGDNAYLIDSRGRDTGALFLFNFETGTKKLLAQSKLADVGGIMLHPTENTVQGVSFNYTRNQWQIKDKAVKQDFAALRKVADGDITVTSRTNDDTKWVVAFLMDNGPVRYYLYDRDSKKAKYLFSNRSDLEGWDLQKMYPVVIDSRDDLKLVSYLTLPPGSDKNNDGKPEKAVPMVLLVHGGPWARDSWGYNPLHQFLANRGYAVLSVNFRGSTGFGKNFLNAGNREWAAKMHDDLIDAVNYAVKNKIAQKDKIAIMGGSYGGYATLVGLTFTPKVFACGVDIVGPSNIVTLLNTIPAYWAPALQLFKDRVGDHTSESGKLFLRDRSPITFVENIERPLLIGQGANDPRVKQSESDQIVEAMKKNEIPVTYVLFPDEGHGFARPENRLAFFAVSEVFLAENLGGRYEAFGDVFNGSSITVPAGASDIVGLPQALPKTKKEEK